MHRVVMVAGLAWALLSVTSATATDQMSDGVTEFVTWLGRETVESGRAVGLCIGVARGDAIVCARGFGLANVELNVPATVDTVYRIGSVTKEFTAAAVLLLVEDGKIDLDAPITSYLPDYPEQGKGVSVRQLLHHTSGVKDFTRLPDYRRDRPLSVSQEQVLERFQSLPLEFQPGEKHRYCNSGYFLLAVIVEQASGKPFREFVEQRLFFKLGMRRTYCDGAARIVPNRASGYTMWGGSLRNAPFVSLNQTVGAGNLACTVTDLIVWQRGLVSHRLLSSGSLKSMTTQGRLNNGKPFNYGCGVRISSVDGHQVFRHGGGISGFRADLAYYPHSDVTIAVLANCDNVNASKLSDSIARHLSGKAGGGIK